MKEYKTNSIKNWSVEDRPREKLLKSGIKSLSNVELLAILIGSGTHKQSALDLARSIMSLVDNKLSDLASMSPDELMMQKGIGEAKAVTMVAAFELASRKNEIKSVKQLKITNSRTAYEILHQEIGDLDHEEFWIILLNRANKVICTQRISQGGMTGTVIDSRIILKNALIKKATGIILSHNHPSGNKNPSEADVNITHKLVSAANHMDIAVLDHIIVTRNEFYSFADNGLL